MADHEDPVGALGAIDEIDTVRDRGGQRLLDEEVLPRVQREPSERRVRGEWCREDHRTDLAVVEDLVGRLTGVDPSVVLPDVGESSGMVVGDHDALEPDAATRFRRSFGPQNPRPMRAYLGSGRLMRCRVRAARPLVSAAG